ncbi:MAG: outer membrane protein assembly factor BamD, partial [Calditrichaeota bacterium]
PLIAQQAFQTLITQFPKGPFARKADWQMVDVLIAEEQYAQAVAVLQKFIEKNSRSAEAQRALIKIGQISLDHLFDIDQAEDAYSRVLTQNQDKRLKLNALYQLALCAQIRGNLEQADDYLQKARAWSVDENLDAEDHALYELALLQLYRHRPSAAIEYLEQIDSNQQPEEMNILENDALELLLLLRENGRDSTGLAAYGDARLLLLQRQYSAARSLLEIIRSSSSTSLAEEMKLLLARVYRQSGEIDLANQVLIEIYGNLEAFSRDYALLCLGENYELQADGDKAKESFEKILVEFPASIYLERARKGIRRLQ